MLPNRLFNSFVAMALVIVVAITVREAAATAIVISDPHSIKGGEMVACLSLASRDSIRTEYEQELDRWVVRTEEGPTGVEGGLIELLSNYRTCSR
jgi:hypothetical protein